MNFKKENLSPIAITRELQEAVSSLPESDSWADYFEGGTGRTIIELIAGSQAIKNHYNLMRVRESSLQVAKLDSSITELAINKGVYRPPAKSYKLKITFNAIADGSIQKGQILGTYKNYKIYSLSNIFYNIGDGNEIEATIGEGERFEKTFTSAKEFEELEILSKHKYVSEEFQTLTINGDEVSLIDENINLYDPLLPNSCLRLVYENYSKLIFGDDILGKRLSQNDEVVYSYLSFGDDLLENFSEMKIQLNLMEDINQITKLEVMRRPSGYLNKEILRKIAMRNSVDGRWVQVEDYQNGILREYGEYIYDILVKDDYPSEEITILPREDNFEEGTKTLILDLVNKKRGNATLVNINYLDPNDTENRLEITFHFIYSGPELDEDVNLIIENYINTKINKIHFQPYWLVSADVAVDLTNMVKGKFYCNLDEKLLIEQFQSIKKIKILYTRQ